MKNLFTLLGAFLIFVGVNAQAPEKMSYQSVVRDANNLLVINHSLGLQVSILQGSLNEPAVYVERHFSATNSNGLVTIEIGSSTLVMYGAFSSIDWQGGPYFLKTEIDLNGGDNYTITGTTQLLSVPYALFAKTSGSSIPGPEGPQGPQGEQGPQGPADGPAGGDLSGTYPNPTIATNAVTVDKLPAGATPSTFLRGDGTWVSPETGITNETDPLWSASPSFGITNTNILNWNNAYAWGNHANAGYLTSFPGLTNFTESNYTYDSRTGVKFTPNNAATDVDIVLQAKGTGSILAQQPDGTTAGGNKRGIYAVDLQTWRTNASQVASGNYATIAGGYDNTASGVASTAMGTGTTAQAQNSLVIGRYNIISGTTTSWVETDPLFVIGNGSGDGNRSNAMTVLKNGNVGIGTTNPGRRLTVNGDMEIGTGPSSYRNFRIGGGNSSGFLYGAFNGLGDGIHIGYNYYHDNTNHIIPHTAGKTSRIHMGYGIIQVLTSSTINVAPTAGVFIKDGATSWSSISDMRLKTNVKTLTNVLENISHIRGVTFNWKEGNQDEQIGFIAQEIEKVFPQVISKNEDDHLAIRYTELIPVLLQAIKEQQKQIETLEERIKILEN